MDGNNYFKNHRFGDAIDAYSEVSLCFAIALCPDVSVYWTNRALCHLKLKLKVPSFKLSFLFLDNLLVLLILINGILLVSNLD
ncbi:unnamed protein product [Sphenostylis stenocarpa]|uniref:RING-type E3 ubiquitin transferase n=1 Tax=Sphenostylis stenocarpa TaxID=92480 RepID=A0AA86S0P2_9FABA|nr:unnamed protein product [Sphenostylis stenocarpa]